MRARPVCITALLIAAVSFGDVRAQSLSVCRKMDDSLARLACYDAVAKAEAAAPPRDTIVSSGDVVGPNSPVRFKATDLDQMSRAPARFVNKPLLFKRMRCTYADVNDYRCRAEGGTSVEVRAPVVVPPKMQTAVEGRCGTLYDERKKACGGEVRVVSTAVRTDGKAGIVVEAPVIAFEIAKR